MPITELNIYKSEWLELVFDDRNQAYGAYDLRKHYANNLLKALGFTILGFVGLLLAYSFFLTHKPAPVHDPVIQVNLMKLPVAKPPVTPPKQKNEPPKVQTVKFPPMVAAVDNLAKNPPLIDDIKVAVIGQTNIKGTPDDGTSNLGIAEGPPAKDITEDNEVKPFGTIEVNPQFPGGEAAWGKFLQKNLHYPAQAIDAGISGKVYVSFVVEKDGHLSDITLVRGVGYGLDAEAMRVMKMAPAWKPGIQNGHEVRVRYTMPFNFQLPTE